MYDNNKISYRYFKIVSHQAITKKNCMSTVAACALHYSRQKIIYKTNKFYLTYWMIQTSLTEKKTKKISFKNKLIKKLLKYKLKCGLFYSAYSKF